MQTIQKRKQWALTALALIATLMLQLFAPITAHAEESTFKNASIIISSSYKVGNNEYAQTDNIAISRNDYVHASTIVCDVGSGITYYYLYLYSNSPFSFTHIYSRDKNGVNNDNAISMYEASMCEHGIYSYNYMFTSFYDSDNNEYYGMTGAPNVRHCDSSTLPSLCDLESEIDLSKDDYKELVFDESTATYNSDIPTPKLTVNNDYSFGFNNASDDYYLQIKGRWYSVDDIELYKENLQWKYKYNSILKGSLTEWVSTQSKTLVSSSNLNFASYGQSAFDSFLSTHPIDNRSYTGGTNAIGNYFSGYSDALNTLKMLLGQPTSIYNGLEVYVRYYTFDSNGNAIYGKWCHYYDNLASSSGSSGSQWDDSENMFTGNQSENGLDDEQFTTVENMTDSRNDIDLVPEYNNSGFESIVLGSVDSTSLVSTLESMYTQTNSFINMIGTVFNFLPSWVTAMICASLGLVCVIGIWKCIKG